MTRIQRLTSELKEYDYELFCKKLPEGVVGVFRRSHYWENHQYGPGENDVLRVLKFAPHFLFALTDDFKKSGRPVEMGSLFIVDRLRKMDLWKRDIAGEMVKDDEKEKESQARDFRNQCEAVFSDIRSSFAKATDDINTSLMMDQKTKQQIKLEKKEHGNY